MAVLLAVVICAGGRVALGQVSVYAPPPDLKSPPADAQKSASGLISRVITPGSGTAKPGADDVVVVDYTGWTSDGTLHDSTYSRGKPSMFPVNRTLKGWGECAQLMVIGEKRRCWVPEPLAYEGAANKPKGTLVFDIELRDTYPNPVVAPSDVKTPPQDAKRSPGGIFYKVLRPGTGTRNPRERDKVVVHYTGWMTNGKVFDSSVARGEAATLGLDEVIKGWSEGLMLMVEGERTRLWIPQHLAYKGETGMPRGMLVFDVELIKIQ